MIGGRRVQLFTLMGFKVSLDFSWFFLAILITWSLATGYFPAVIEGLSPNTALMLGLSGAIGLFISIIFHEFAHSWVARNYGLPVEGITLFVFGGVAELKEEPPSPKIEFWVAIAGPISSYLLAALCYGVASLNVQPTLGPVAALFGYLALINVILATFNLVPAFPLDGGRVLRAVVWWRTGNLKKATTVAATMGKGFGSLLILLGVLGIVTGNTIGGIWQVLIGVFIIGAAKSVLMQLELRLGLADVNVSRVMSQAPIFVPADLSVADLVSQYFYGHFHKAFPVLDTGKVVGMVRLKDVGKVQQADWPTTCVTEILSADSMAISVRPDLPLYEALKKMQTNNASRLMVIDNGILTGMITMRDVMDYLTLVRELKQAPGP